MNSARPIIVGAVLYDPKVSVIWDIIRDYFASNDCPIDCVYYTNYELQVRGLIDGHIDIAWNCHSPGSTLNVKPAIAAARLRCATPIATA